MGWRPMTQQEFDRMAVLIDKWLRIAILFSERPSYDEDVSSMVHVMALEQAAADLLDELAVPEE